MTEKQWLKQMLHVILKSTFNEDEKVKAILNAVDSYEAMKEI